MNSSNATQLGGLEFFILNISDYLPYTVVNLLGILFGTLGNLLTVAAILYNKDMLKNSTNILILNLSVADLAVSSFLNSFVIVGVLVGKPFFDARPVLCEFAAAWCVVSCEASIINMGLLSLNRYINICHHSHYNKYFSINKTAIYCAVTWLYGMLIDLPTFTGWSDNFYDPKSLNCIFDRTKSHSYMVFFFIISIIIPCTLIFIFYMRIFCFVRTSTRRVHANSKSSETDKSVRIAAGLFGSFALFTLCWFPYGLVLAVDKHDVFNRNVYMFTMAVAHLHSSMNPVLYALTNPAFKIGYKQLFCAILCQRKSTIELTATRTRI